MGAKTRCKVGRRPEIMEKTLIRDFVVSGSLTAAGPAAVEQCFLSAREPAAEKGHLYLLHVPCGGELSAAARVHGVQDPAVVVSTVIFKLQRHFPSRHLANNPNWRCDVGFIRSDQLGCSGGPPRSDSANYTAHDKQFQQLVKSCSSVCFRVASNSQAAKSELWNFVTEQIAFGGTDEFCFLINFHCRMGVVFSALG